MRLRMLLNLLNSSSLEQSLISVLCITTWEIPEAKGFYRLLGGSAMAWGLFYQERGELAQAQHNFEAAIQAFTRIQDLINLGRALNSLSLICLQQQQPARSLAYSQAAVAILEPGTAPQDYAFAVYQLGVSHLREGQLAQAESCLERALSLYDQLQAPLLESQVLLRLGELYAQQEVVLFALACYEAALDNLLLHDEKGECKALLIDVLRTLAIFCQETEQEGWANLAYQDVLNHFLALDKQAQAIQIFRRLGAIHESQQRYRLALECYEYALRVMPVTSSIQF
ncbi:MAG: hypothetical protein AAGE59_23635 [Cyanobacteria bacterium P01_F01_bin.86]